MTRPKSSWRPPHCPNDRCNSHSGTGGWRYKRKGFFRRRSGPERIQRYVCHQCGRSFSTRTFQADYWLRRGDLLAPLFFRINACSALRQIAREFGVAPSTVQRHVERLGRHCLLVHERLRPKAPPREPLVLDGFRAFESGRYWPFDLNLVVGPSHFVYGISDAELRRGGRMTGLQRQRRAKLEARYGRPDPRATRRSVLELLRRILPEGSTVELRTDEHPAYRGALTDLRDCTVVHRTTSSRAPRTFRNALYPVNLADLLLRHCGANHKRRTLALSKRRQGALYRAAIWLVWRNYVQWSSERRRTAPPGVRIGAIARRLLVSDLLEERLFPWREGLQGWVQRAYFARIPTRCLGPARRHELRYAV